MKIIDVETWDRKVPYENFINYTNPVFSLAAPVDVTKLYAYGKSGGTSFFANFLYVVTRSINETEPMRIRIRDDKPVLFDKINASFIVMNDIGVISTCRVGYDKSYKKFYRGVMAGIESTRKSRQQVFDDPDKNDLIYVSAIKWLDFTSFSNPYDFKDQARSSIPRVTWGKIKEADNKKFVTLDIAAHHALVDGYPVALVFDKISKYIDDMSFTEE